MNIIYLIALVLLGASLLGALVWIVCLKQTLQHNQEENQRLRHLLLLDSHRAQKDLETLRKLRHDLRHYLRFAKVSTLPDTVLETLNHTAEQPTPSDGLQNWTLSTLEHYYQAQGKALGFDTDIRLNLSLPREELLPDLCLVISNLLENAIEALQREGGGWLRARSLATSGYISLVIGNSCSRPLRTYNGHYLSSKKEGRIGVGLSTVQSIVQRYGGKSEFSTNGSEFRAEIFLPCASSKQSASGPVSIPRRTVRPHKSPDLICESRP